MNWTTVQGIQQRINCSDIQILSTNSYSVYDVILLYDTEQDKKKNVSNSWPTHNLHDIDDL